jgi:type IV secretory pathway VirD2 relaxase
MVRRDDDFRVRPGRIRGGAKMPSYVAQVTRAAKKAGHTGKRFGGGASPKGGSHFGRGHSIAARIGLNTSSRRVVVMARVVRHHGRKFRAASLALHITYLNREGVTRDGSDARMFDAASEDADVTAFAERSEEDRHHFRFTVSPEDAGQMADLKAFTRELMKTAERDLETRLDWVAVDHWNTDNPHIHILVRGRADNGKDLVISRDYISRGLRLRASERVTLELGPRSEHEIRTALQKDVVAERWTGLDRALRDMTDDAAGIADLRPLSSKDDPEIRRLLVGRTQTLERLGLAEQIAPGRWMLKPNIEDTLRDLSIRGDIIKTMHRAMSGLSREPDEAAFALHDGPPETPVVGRLAARGLHDELSGTGYAVIEGIDGRSHHLRFSNLEMTGDAVTGAIVESRAYTDDKGKVRLALAVRSDLGLESQITASGATWLDRQLLTPDPRLANAAFGTEVREAMEARRDHLIEQGLAQQHGQRVIYARDLLATLRQRELDQTAARLSAETGLAHQSFAEGTPISGTYRQRVTLASGRFAMIDDGLGFQLVPWRPALEEHLGREVRGIATGSGIEWSLGRKRGLGI